MAHTLDLPAKYTMSRRDHEKRKENIMSELTLIENCKYSINSNYAYTKSLNSDYTSTPGYVFVMWEKESNKKFIQENIKKLDLIITREFNSQNVDNMFLEVAKKIRNDIAQLNFSDVIIEYLNNNSIQFTLSFPDKKLLMIDKFLYPKENDLSDEQVIYSYFINRKLISSNVVEISDFVKKFQEYIAM